MKEQDYPLNKQPHWPKRNITLGREAMAMETMKQRCLELTENMRELSPLSE